MTPFFSDVRVQPVQSDGNGRMQSNENAVFSSGRIVKRFRGAFSKIGASPSKNDPTPRKTAETVGKMTWCLALSTETAHETTEPVGKVAGRIFKTTGAASERAECGCKTMGRIFKTTERRGKAIRCPAGSTETVGKATGASGKIDFANGGSVKEGERLVPQRRNAPPVHRSIGNGVGTTAWFRGTGRSPSLTQATSIHRLVRKMGSSNSFRLTAGSPAGGAFS